MAVERRTAAYSRYRASRNQPLPTDAAPSAEDEIKRLQAEVSLARQLSRQDSAVAPVSPRLHQPSSAPVCVLHTI